MSGFETTAKTAKSGVRAARKALSRVLQGGQARARDVVDSSGRKANDSLDAVEQAVLRALDNITQRGERYTNRAKGRLYAAEGRLFPRRQPPPIGTALVGVGVGLLLTLLFAESPPAKAAHRRT
ncbi:MAG TPA: hypothetical protein VIJ59_05440 [Caulobacteraceae bacterium]